MITTESVTINVPIGMSKYLKAMNTETELVRNALLLYPYILNQTISHGGAAEILGIKKSNGSEINMFKEYDMVMREKFSEYFGFLDTEIDTLFQTYLEITEEPKITREDLRIWYDGYPTKKGKTLSSPFHHLCPGR